MKLIFLYIIAAGLFKYKLHSADIGTYTATLTQMQHLFQAAQNHKILFHSIIFQVINLHNLSGVPMVFNLYLVLN